MTADFEMPVRNVLVSFVPPLADSKTVRFRGTTFQDLKGRLIEAKVPGVGATSYVEVEMPSEGFICLLDEDWLPEKGNLSVQVHLDIVKGKEPIIVPGEHAPPGRMQPPGPMPPPEGVPPRRWAKHMHKLHKMDRKMREHDARLQQKVHRMYSRLERHGAMHSPPGSPPKHGDEPAVGVPEDLKQPPHHHHHHHHLHNQHHRHALAMHHGMHRPGPFPHFYPPPLGIPVPVGPPQPGATPVRGSPVHVIHDPSGSGAVPEPAAKAGEKLEQGLSDLSVGDRDY